MQLLIENLNSNVTTEFTIQIRHLREQKRIKRSGEVVVNPKGGVTIMSSVSIKHPLPRIYYSRCHKDDSYNKREGIERCLIELVRDSFGLNECYFSLPMIPENGGKTIRFCIFKVEDLSLTN